MMKWITGLFLIASDVLFGQLVTSIQSPASVVQNTLLGTGVTVSNITFSGASGAIGTFTANGTNLGINSGVVITTGTIANNGAGPQGPNDLSNAGVDNGRPGYFLLNQQLGSNNTFNSSVLEFDFIPYSDTVEFKYVFGSEEYPEYVGTPFNDIFAFFIAGPGISGIQNIAKLPNGQVVAINNVNNGNPGGGQSNPSPAVNPQWFVPNGNGNQAPYNASSSYIQYDGFTKVLKAVSPVQCGKTYHLIIAIADVGDGIYDSGIFLEANSLSSKMPVEITYELSNDAFNDSITMAEGCTTAKIKLKRNGNVSQPLTIPISISGTATQNVDYGSVPTSVTFAAGQSYLEYSFPALFDGLTEGIETIQFTYELLNACGEPVPWVINLQINDVQPVQVTVNSDTMTCPGEEVPLIATATGGGGSYSYIWSNGETTQSIQVSPTTTQNYSVSVTDACLNQSATAIATVTVPVFQPINLNASPDITEICPYIAHDLWVNPTGGAGFYSYVWTNPLGETLGTTDSINVAPSTSTNYSIEVTDLCGNVAIGEIMYTITSPPLVLTMSPNQTICPGDSVQISVTATGGYGQYYYNWLHSDETTATIWVNPYSTTTYTVSVSDECQTFTVEGSAQVTVLEPIANFTISSHTLFNDLPITFQNLSSGAITYQWDFGDGQTSTLVHPNNTYDDPGTYYITLIATNYLGCKDTVVKPISIEEEWWIYVPNTFTPDGNEFNNNFSARYVNIIENEVQIFNRWGELVYSSNDIRWFWDGTYDAKPCPDGTYTYKIKFVTKSGIEDTVVGHVNVLR